MHHLLVHNYAIDKLRVEEGAAVLLHDLDVVKIHIPLTVSLFGNLQHGLHSQVCKILLHSLGDLPAHRGHGYLLQSLRVCPIHRDRNLSEVLSRHVKSLLESAYHNGGVDVLLQKLLSLLQQSASQHHGGGCAVAGLLLLGLRYLHQQFGDGVLDVHLVQDRCAVVGDGDVAEGVNEHLVHALRAERGSHNLGYGSGNHYIQPQRLFSKSPLSALLQHEHRHATYLG